MQRVILYCAVNRDGNEARELLDKSNIDYELHYWPNEVSVYKTPVLETPFGVYRTLEEIREFVTIGIAKQFEKV